MYSQIYNPIVKTTMYQVKKHFSQMELKEINFLKNKLERIQNYISLSFHGQEKNNGISSDTVKSILKSGNFDIIEYNEVPKFDATEHRVLIRDKQSYISDFYSMGIVEPRKALCNICFVISLDTGIIVTAYLNKCNDKHDTIDWTRYKKDLKIMK